MAYQITSLPPTINANLAQGLYHSQHESFLGNSNYTVSFSSGDVTPLLICPSSDFVRVYYNSSLNVVSRNTANYVSRYYSFFVDFQIIDDKWAFPSYTIFEWPTKTINAFPYLDRLPDISLYGSYRTSNKSDSCFYTEFAPKTAMGSNLNTIFSPYLGVTLDEKSEVWFTLSAIFIFILIVTAAIRLFIYPFWRKVKK